MLKRVVDLIGEKRDGKEHSNEEIDHLISEYSHGSIPDYQMSAWLMAVLLMGLSKQETASLTRSMISSGSVLNLSTIKGPTVDKHSTGGVGDKTSLAVVPLLAACGVSVAKMSGRGLANTGGTLDKLDSIHGFRSNLSAEEVVAQVKKIGLCICAQTDDLVPADKKLYALRDATGTVPSIPLIAASIMSKKIATGSESIVIDIKVGSGAFMKTVTQARNLAHSMIEIGSTFGRKTAAILTDMDSPLGRAVGNRLEIDEAIRLLKNDGRTDKRLLTLVKEITVLGLLLSEKCDNRRHAENMFDLALHSGDGFERFKAMVNAQGGSIENTTFVRSNSTVCVPVRAAQDGFIESIDADEIGLGSMRLGAGRVVKDDNIDPDAGIEICAGLGEHVNQGDLLANLYSQSEKTALSATNGIASAWKLSSNPVDDRPVILETIWER